MRLGFARITPLEKSLLLIALALGLVLPLLVAFDKDVYFRLEPHIYGDLHSLLEIASILVSFSVFIVNWEASKQSRNTQTLFVATGFLAVAAIDVMHTLSYSSIPSFVTPNSMAKTIYFWLFARLWAAGVLLTAAFVPTSGGRLLSRYPLAAVNLSACLAVFVAVTYYAGSLPVIYVDQTGVTGLKVAAEYLVVGMNVAAAAVCVRRFRKGGDSALAILALALVVSGYSEVSLTLYRDPHDVYNLVGHVYKVVAYYLIFRALLVSSVVRPYVQLRTTNQELAQAVAELNQRTRELDALDDVALTLSSSLRPDELLASAMDKVMAVMQASSGAIFLVDEERDELQLAAWRGLKASTVAQFQAHPAMLRNIAATQGTVSGRPGEGSHAGAVPSRTTGRVSPLQICVCAPVTTKGQLLGAITMVAGDDGRAFGPSDVDLLTAVGYQLGLAIENARLYGRTDERLREKLLELGEAERKSRFLAEAGALLSGSMDLGKVLAVVAQKATEVVGDWCAVYLMDEREKEMKLAAVYHSDQDELEEISVILARRAPGAGEGLVGSVAQSGEALLVVGEAVQRLSLEIESLVQTPEELASIRRTLPSSAIIAPMRARGATVGVLVVTETHSSEPLKENDLALLVELGDRAGVAVQNSQLLEESQAQRRHLEAVISQMVDGVVIADAEGEVVVTNTAAEAMLRGQMAGLIGQPSGHQVESEVDGAGGDRVPLIKRAIEGDPILGEEILVASDSGERVLSASASAVRDDVGEVTGAVVVMRDVTAEREVERMKDEFIATVSHELRTPITAVLGYTDLLLRGMRGPLMPAQSDALSSVRNAGRRLLSLIEDLLDISKLEAGKQELFVDVVNVAGAVDRALSSVALTASNKKVRIEQQIPEDLPPVLADEPQLQRILGNLLSNALKFTPEAGVVTISARTGGPDGSSEATPSYVTILVTDTGVGIPFDKQGQIWEKFQQADSSSSRMFGGTGLGLAIVKALVDLHGGTVWVKSEGIPGKGSTFGFTLPAADLGVRTDGLAMPQFQVRGGGS